MKILMFVFLCVGLYSHDIQVAFFKIHQENEKFAMDIIMEKNDVVSSFEVLGINLTDRNFQDYIRDNISLIINRERQILCFESMQINSKHITMTCHIEEMNEIIESIELRNTCLLNIENHSNIIEFRIDDSERDFLMNNERTTITVKY